MIEAFNKKFCDFYSVDGFEKNKIEEDDKEEFPKKQKIMKYFHSMKLNLK